VKIPLGGYNSLLGKSYPEIAAEARSKHRSQGFGSAPSRSERTDFGLFIKGEKVQNDLFEDIDLTWNRVAGGKQIKEKIEAVLASFDFKNPSKSTKALLDIYSLLAAMPENHFKASKLEECKNLILSSAGVYVEASAQNYAVSAGDQLRIFFTAINRSESKVKLLNLKINGLVSKDSILNQTLEYAKALENSVQIKIPENAKITQPYWLEKKAEKGLYQIQDKKLTGLPMAPAVLEATFDLEIDGVNLSFNHPIRYKYTEPSRGEIYKYLEIRPRVMLNLDQMVYLFPDQKEKKISLTAKANQANTEAKISLDLPQGWSYSPKEIIVNFKEKNQDKKVEFSIFAPAASSEVTVTAIAKVGTETMSKGLNTISYEHIPELNTFPEATALLKKIDIKKKGTNIGYIAGAGDLVPDALRQIGYNVAMLTEKDLNKDLQKLDAIIIGVRAYNTEDWLVNAQEQLLNYVQNGGRMVVQYQTQAFFGTIKTKEMGPYPLNIGRGRVTDENAEMRILNPADITLNTPNKLNETDYKNWVQERGLYFADKWSDKYTTVFAMKDQGETEQEGGLLYTQYGKGYYVFTGISFFRQLPAGVPGAFRLMANLISIGKK
jgi:hypothetical protein